MSRSVEKEQEKELKVEEHNNNIIQLTQEQFIMLLNRVPTTSAMSNKNFTRCSSLFYGERDDHIKVEQFIDAICIFKDVEKMTDDEALIGLPMLLKGEATKWWQGVRSDIKTWSAALQGLKSAFAPKRQPHDIYIELFATTQGKNETIDEFLCQKRALLGLLPPKRHKEEEELDFVYGLLRSDLKKVIARTDVKTFQQLLDKARHQESLAKNDEILPSSSNMPPPPPPTRGNKRCAYCSKKGHLLENCRKRQSDLTARELKPVINCYGCGAPGVFRSNCPTCKSKDSPPKPVSFYKIETTLEDHIKIPTIEINVKGEPGYAYIDTAARTSIASLQLYEVLKKNETYFYERRADISLADGSIKNQKLLSTTVQITLGNRTLPISFTIMPEANDNRTLLGIDFLEAAGIQLNLPQRVWNFIDKPNDVFYFSQIRNTKIPIVKAIKKIDFANPTSENEGLSKFLDWARDLRMLSPLPATPSPPKEDDKDASPTKKPRWQLKEVHTPLYPTRPREPADDNSRVDPRIDYLPINPIQLYSLNIPLQPNEGHSLSNCEKEQLNNLLLSYEDRFLPNGPPTTYMEHRIDTGNKSPIAVKPYRLSPTRQQQLRIKLDEMIDNNIIEECDSPWCSPVILVPKANGDVRVCIDFRKLNEITVPDRYPLPRIDDLLHQARAMPFMSTIDLHSGFWQIQVHPDDQIKTAFITPFGMYQFLRMPFGLRNAPATFQRLMDKFIHGLKAQCVLSYLDDLIIRSNTFEQHLQDLKEVFEKLKLFKLRANREKCIFGCSKIKYLGHIIVPEGIETDEEKITAILNRPEPKNLKQLISFLQTASWYRRFIENFADIARPLTNLTKKQTKMAMGKRTKRSIPNTEKNLNISSNSETSGFQFAFYY
ncbi:uncharacterized protein LOC126378061 [Pectinophora gossypiella]|uniref:uncharacterized protein LOC126378061 n=1 Tax=Pectinophora gossypiella TaxID=13191 RepID=UPI00214F3BEE|nr:uncharacterized protein LOC126378061 [Pectinophora gossypiella]